MPVTPENAPNRPAAAAALEFCKVCIFEQSAAACGGDGVDETALPLDTEARQRIALIATLCCQREISSFDSLIRWNFSRLQAPIRHATA